MAYRKNGTLMVWIKFLLLEVYMHLIKRDKSFRAYSHGYRAGIRGKPESKCPYQNLDSRGAWFNGWREGRLDNLYGNIPKYLGAMDC